MLSTVHHCATDDDNDTTVTATSATTNGTQRSRDPLAAGDGVAGDGTAGDRITQPYVTLSYPHAHDVRMEIFISRFSRTCVASSGVPRYVCFTDSLPTQPTIASKGGTP